MSTNHNGKLVEDRQEKNHGEEASVSNNHKSLLQKQEAIAPPLDSTSLPRSNRDYVAVNYWDDRFVTEDSYEWLLSYEQLEPQLQGLLRSKLRGATTDQSSEEEEEESAAARPCRILVVGCGNAPFSVDLYRACQRMMQEIQNHSGSPSNNTGFEIVNIDYSITVIEKMQQTYPPSDYPGMTWHVADMTKLDDVRSILEEDQDDHSKRQDDTALSLSMLFDLVIDKATMDAMLADEGDVWYPNIVAVRRARDVCRCISRLLSPDNGVFVQISLIQPHFRKKYLLGIWQLDQNEEKVVEIPLSTKASEDLSSHPYSTEYRWTVQSEPAGRPQDVAGSFGHYFYTMKK